MKNTAIRNLVIGAMFASLLGASAVAPAMDWHDRDRHDRPVIVRHDASLEIGLGLGLVAAALILDRPRHREVVCAPPIIERRVVIERRDREFDRRHDDRRGGWR